MSFEKTITQAWQRKALWLWLLLPLSGLYGLIIKLRQWAYRLGILNSYRAPIPVLIVGNISVGGSGKTPLIITLVQYLQQQGVRVGVISRGYGGDSSQMPALVQSDSLPSVVGDEPCLIVNMTGVAMAVCPNREQAIAVLLGEYPDLQLIISDDGLQHYALERDIEWIVVDTARGFGNQQLLPTGFLREPMSRLKDASVIFHIKSEKKTEFKDIDLSSAIDQKLSMQLKPDKLTLLWQQPRLTNDLDQDIEVITPIEGRLVHAVSGIGYPQRFFDTLSTLGFEIIEHPYGDHHAFTVDELLQYNDYPIIVTAKDAVKIKALLMTLATEQGFDTVTHDLINRLWVLPVTAVLSEPVYQNLNQQLEALGIPLSTP